MRWDRRRRAWTTRHWLLSGLCTWVYDPARHVWVRAEKVPAYGATRSETWALRQDDLLREQNRLIEEQNRLLAGLPPPPPEPTVIPADGPAPRK